MTYCFPALGMCSLLNIISQSQCLVQPETKQLRKCSLLTCCQLCLASNPRIESPTLYLSLYAVMYFCITLAHSSLHCVLCSFREALQLLSSQWPSPSHVLPFWQSPSQYSRRTQMHTHTRTHYTRVHKYAYTVSCVIAEEVHLDKEQAIEQLANHCSG